MSLSRFHEAHADPGSGYSTALAEIRKGCKTSHWIWYIFPQIDGLGRSSTAREYALRGLEETCDYLRDPLLRAHYEEIAAAVAGHLSRGVAVEDLMGDSTDALKLASSLTLFQATAIDLAKSDATFIPLAKRCDAILQQITTQGYPPCAFTLEKIAHLPGAGHTH